MDLLLLYRPIGFSVSENAVYLLQLCFDNTRTGAVILTPMLKVANFAASSLRFRFVERHRKRIAFFKLNLVPVWVGLGKLAGAIELFDLALSHRGQPRH